MPVYKNNEIHARLVRPKAANSGVFAFAGVKLGGMLALARLPNAEAASDERAAGVGTNGNGESRITVELRIAGPPRGPGGGAFDAAIPEGGGPPAS